MRIDKNKITGKKILSLMVAGIVFISSVTGIVLAAEPTGNNWFEIRMNPFTGKDDSGDGGTGHPDDLNYYYVGQVFDGAISIRSSGASAANIWIDHNPALMQISNLTGGSYFNSWKNQTIQSGRMKSTGYNLPLAFSSGIGSFGSFKLQMLRPSAANYGKGSPAILDINTGQIGKTTESNIANNGQDILNSAEDFHLHIWADTKKPYAKNPLPVSGAINVPVDSLYRFDLRDSLRGEADDSGVGTGVNIDSEGADIVFNSGTNTFSLKQNATYICSGVWGSNLCNVTVTRPPVTGFAGDARRWLYNTTYTVQISGYKDLASSNQSQLGDANGPNMMDAKTFTFKTIPDTVAPRVMNISPANGSVDQPSRTIISFDAQDRLSYPNGMSGSGIKSGTCRIDVSSPSFPLKTYKGGDAGVTVVNIDYGRRITVDTNPGFGSGETVTVRIHSCEDIAGNKMQDVNFSFKVVTIDSDGDGIPDHIDNCPYIYNPDQRDMDGDGVGDACDPDIDGDGIPNATDNCPYVPNPQQKDMDGDGVGDVCDPDVDGDGIPNTTDNCPYIYNPDQRDTDKDGVGDVCDPDIDGDGIPNATDNCPYVPNPQQKDMDGDGVGDVCDPDIDGDEILNEADNCPYIYNPDQRDMDGDGVGDACDPDIDGDGVPNEIDNCIYTFNPYQEDTNKNGIGDACDAIAGAIDYNIKAKPEKRVLIGGQPDLKLDSSLIFYNRAGRRTDWQDRVELASDGTYIYASDKISIGDYDVALKGESHLQKIIRNITIGEAIYSVDLDYTFGGTYELIAGDVYSDNIINSFDIAVMLLSYGSKTGGFTDLTKDGYTNAPDMALLIINYFKKGESF